MKYFIKSVCTGALISGGSFLLSSHTSDVPLDKPVQLNQQQARPPNIILIMTDQHNADYLHCMGRSYLKTPNLDRLAGQSGVFRSAYSASPVCGPSRAAIFTGRFPLQNGVYTNWIPLRENSVLLTDRLAGAGYYNIMIGKLHLTPADSAHGFNYRRMCDSPYDVYDKREVQCNDYLPWAAKGMGISVTQLIENAGESERCKVSDPRFWIGGTWADDAHQMTAWTGNEAVRIISDYNEKKPFFMHVSFFGPHHPYSTCEPWNSMYRPDEVTLPPTLGMAQPGAEKGNRFDWPLDLWRKIIAEYSGSISSIDLQIGRILSALKEKGLWENTVIVFTSDHGDSMGDYSQLGKGTMLESSVRVPFFIKPPGNNLHRHEFPEVISLIDLYSTLLDYAGVTESGAPDSRTIRPLLNGEAGWNNKIFSSLCGADGQNGQVMLIEDKFKCVGFLKNGKMTTELYDRTEKIADLHNLEYIPEYSGITDRMKSELEDWLMATRKK
jgi:arylsulfatase